MARITSVMWAVVTTIALGAASALADASRAEGNPGPAGGQAAESGAVGTSALLACILSCSATVPQTTFAGDPTVFHAAVLASGCSGSPAIDWDFGDGSPHATDVDAVHTYTTLGAFSWTLIVTMDGQSCTRSGSIQVDPPPPCSLQCTAKAPGYAQVSQPAAFQSQGIPDHCTGEIAYDWDFGDGTPHSSEQNPPHSYDTTGEFTWSVTISVEGRECTKSGTIAIGPGACRGPYHAIIPVAAHQPGLNGTQWRSDLDVFSYGSIERKIDLALLATNQANLDPPVATITPAPGRSLRVNDLLGSLLPGSSGAIGIRVCGCCFFLINSRFHTTTEEGGSLGTLVPAEHRDRAIPRGWVGRFHHLTYSADPRRGFRVNIGLVNAVAFAVDVIVDLLGDDGEPVGSLSTRLRPFEHKQYTRIHATLGTGEVASGAATVRVLTRDALVHAYAMLIDNVSGAPTYVPVEVVDR